MASFDLAIRVATEADTGGIIDLFRSAYGDGYMYPQFYETTGIKKMIFSDGTVVLVAEDLGSGALLGTASVELEIGAFSDLVGEFGRLVVRPEARGRGVATRLMAGRIEQVRDRLHVGLVEARTLHPYSCRVAERHGFAPVGILPNRLIFGGERESAVLYVRHFGDALALRKNHPRIIPEAYDLAVRAASNVGYESDVIVDEEAAPYPYGGSFDVEELQAEGYSSLVRIERGRVRDREVFGPLKLHYGFFKLAATRAHYLIARSGGRIAGAIGFIRDPVEGHVRIFELIHIEEDAVRWLLAELDRRITGDSAIVTVEIDVNADSTRLQRTLLELGYRPTAYLPAQAFHRVERRDVIKMWKLEQDPLDQPAGLPDGAAAVCELVLRAYRRQRMLPRIRSVMDRVGLFAGLTREQARRLGGLVEHREIPAGERLFEEGMRSDEMYFVMDGSVSIRSGAAEVGTVGPGECVGEVALLAGGPHSASAVATRDVEAGVVTRARLTDLVRRRPDIGVALYRNLACELGAKLRRAGPVEGPR